MEKQQKETFKIIAIIEKFLDKSLLFICAIVFLGLIFYSFKYTGKLIESTEIPIIMPDSIVRNIMTLLLVTLLLFIFSLILGKNFISLTTPPNKIKFVSSLALFHLL